MDTTRLKRLSNNLILREGALLLGLYWTYSSIRWFVARDGDYEAVQHAFKIIELETQLGIFHEPTIQRFLIDNALWIVKIANVFYSLGYFPVLILTGALLYRHAPQRFFVFKLTFLLGLGFALFCFSVFPLTPPRMLPELGFVDTQEVYGSGLYNQEFFLSFYNPHAAMPSLHFGWALLVGIVAYSFNRRTVKAIAILYPCSMALVIVVTGHHYFLDIAGGGVVVGLSYALVRGFPHIAKDLSSLPIGVSSHESYRKRTVDPWSSSRRTYGTSSHWSVDQNIHARRQDIHTKLMAFIISRRPPL